MTRRSRLVHRAALFLILTLVAPSAWGSEPTRVLVLHSYNTDFRWTRDLDAGVRSVLNADPEQFTVLHAEYLDAKYFFDEESLRRRADDLAAKYAGYRFDGIIVFDNIALEFLRRNRDALFGAVPTVFAGINGFEPALIDGLSDVTGVVEALSIRETLSFIGEIYPDGTRLWILADSSVTSRRNMALIRAAIDTIAWHPDVRVVSEPTVASLEAINIVESNERGHGVAIIVGSLVEPDGALMDFWRAGRTAGIHLDVPTFSFWDFYLETGVVGGLMTRGLVQGARAGELMAAVLAGQPADEIPIVTESPNEWVFDRTALRRFGIGVRHLPEGARLVNGEPTLWDEYALEIVVVAAMLLALGTLVGLLLVTIRRRAETANRLRESIAEKDVLLREIHHRVKNNLQVISSILSLQSGVIDDETARHYFLDCDSRVRSMALVHEQLYESTSLARIDMERYIDELVRTVSALMAPERASYRVVQSVDPIELDLDTAIPVGLLVNEVLSNAFKYAVGCGADDGAASRALPDPRSDGTPVLIDVGLHATVGDDGGPRDLELSIGDTGPGLPPDARRRGSLGLELVDALSQQIGGRAVYSDNAPGARVTIIFPAPTGRRHAGATTVSERH